MDDPDGSYRTSLGIIDDQVILVRIHRPETQRAIRQVSAPMACAWDIRKQIEGLIDCGLNFIRRR